MHSFKERLAREDGFTLIELLVVLIIIGVLLAIAIPSYLGFQKSAQQTAAAADVRSAIPDAEEYYNDNSQTYTGMTVAKLQGYDSGMLAHSATQPGILTVKASADGTQYCISAQDANEFSHVAGPGGIVKTKETSDACTAWTSGPST